MTVKLLRPMSAAERARNYRERKKAEAQAAIVTPEIADVTNVTSAITPTRVRAGGVTVGIILSATGVLLAGLGACMTTAYLATGADGVNRLLFGGLAASADALALLSPSAGVMLWRGRRRLLGLGAWMLWLAASAATVSNLAGFIGGHADAIMAGREAAVATRGMTMERVTRLRDERRRVNEQRPADAIAVAVRNASRAHVDAQRSALAVARRRDAIDAELRMLEHSLAELPTVTIADASAAVLAGAVAMVTGVVVSEEVIRRVRLLILIVLPLAGGLVLAVGLAAARGRS
jgi:hypothetical protein